MMSWYSGVTLNVTIFHLSPRPSNNMDMRLLNTSDPLNSLSSMWSPICCAVNWSISSPDQSYMWIVGLFQSGTNRCVNDVHGLAGQKSRVLCRISLPTKFVCKDWLCWLWLVLTYLFIYTRSSQWINCDFASSLQYEPQL